MTGPLPVEVRELSFRYPGAQRPVVSGLSLSIAAGERVAILGPNGSGKTTLALHLNGLLLPEQGSVTIGDLPVDADNLRRIRRCVGMVFQDPNDQLFMQTVHDDVSFGPANLGWDRDVIERATARALAAVDAEDIADRTPHHLSGGEKRRAAIATVLAMDPAVLVLDEPTAGLDPVGRNELGDLLRRLPQTQIIVTHDLPFALATCDRSLILDDGRIQSEAPTRELLADPDRLAEHRLALPFGYHVPD